MSDDYLHTPLRPRRWRDRLRLRATPAQLAMALLAVGVIGAGLWAWMAPPPPVADTVIERKVPDRPVPPRREERDTADLERHPVPPSPSQEARRRKDVKVISPATRHGRGVKIIDVSRLPDGATGPAGDDAARRAAPSTLRDFSPLPRAPLKGLVEKTPFGPLPKVGADGRKPWRAYARPVSPRLLAAAKPKLAVLVTDVGLNAALTQRALGNLSPEVSLALVPHVKNSARLGHEARRLGHEFFLQVPMEPWGYPAVNPGPGTLLASATADENRRRLMGHMGRAVGYAGLVSYAGQKFLQNGEALAPVLHEIKRRGLMAVDDATATDSMMRPLGQVIALPVVRADVRVPPDTTPADARAAFARARALAERQGTALLVVSAGTTALRELADWIAGIESDETIALIPVTALAKLREPNRK